jgi:hypothetical protein
MKTKYYFLVIFALSIFSIAAQKAVTADDVVGTWKYLISDVPPEYESGFLLLSKRIIKRWGM